MLSNFNLSLNQLPYSLLRIRVKLYQYWQYATKNPQWFLMFLLCRFQIVRYLVSSWSKPPLLDQYIENNSLFEILAVEDVVTTMKKDGLYFGINLPDSITQEILDFANSTHCFANRDKELRFNFSEKEDWEAKHGKKIVVGEYLKASQQCLALKKLENDPKLLKIAATYLNSSEFVCTGSRLWWSFAGNATTQERLNFGQELFHYDPDDYGAIKFFFYLTDVDLSSGPHVCVRGSHKKKKLSYQLTLFIGRSDDEIVGYYKPENVMTICEKAGFGLAEDPFCFHKGTPPTERNRLMLEVGFRLNDYRLWKTA